MTMSTSTMLERRLSDLFYQEAENLHQDLDLIDFLSSSAATAATTRTTSSSPSSSTPLSLLPSSSSSSSRNHGAAVVHHHQAVEDALVQFYIGLSVEDGRLSHEERIGLKCLLVEHNAIEIILQAMQRGIRRHPSSSTSSSFSSSASTSSSTSSSPSSSPSLSSKRKQNFNSQFYRRGCSCLTYIIRDCDESHALRFIRVGGLEIILQVMRVFESNQVIQWYCFDLLGLLTIMISDSPRNDYSIINTLVGNLVVTISDMHGKSPRLYQKACRSLSSLLETKPDLRTEIARRVVQLSKSLIQGDTQTLVDNTDRLTAYHDILDIVLSY